VNTGGDNPRTVEGEELAKLANMHLAAETVIERLSNFMDAEALRAIADGVQIKLDTIGKPRTAPRFWKPSCAS
jgi:DNA gyrase subunit B